MFQRGFFLLLTRDDGLALIVSDPIQRFSVVRRATTCREAAGMLAERARWSGVVVDLDGLDEGGLAAVASVREAHPLVPILAVGSRISGEQVNDLYALRAELVLKPIGDANVVSFAQRALCSGWLPDERVSARIDQLARTKGLTAREVQLTAYGLGNESRERVMRRLGITENTLKTQVRALLRKVEETSMDSLAKSILCASLVFESYGEAGALSFEADSSFSQSASA
jgi:DNA-binding NarL/FixJ family response regulator